MTSNRESAEESLKAIAVAESDPHKALGANLLALRKARAWTVRDLSAKSGVSLYSCSRAERGFAVTLANVVRLAAAFGVTVDDLLQGTP